MALRACCLDGMVLRSWRISGICSIVRFSVPDFFDQRHHVKPFPPNAKLLWKLPK